MKNAKSFWSVVYRTWGADREYVAWFDNKDDAYNFANHDYRNSPIRHNYLSASRIKDAEELVNMTKYNLSL